MRYEEIGDKRRQLYNDSFDSAATFHCKDCSVYSFRGAFGCWMRASHQTLYAIIELETQCYSLALAPGNLVRDHPHIWMISDLV